MSTTATAETKTSTWTIDPAHSLAEFKVRHMMISNVKGRFTRLSGRLVLDEQQPANSSVEAEIDAASIATGDEQRDSHLKSPDFFDVEKFPVLKFRSTIVQPDGESEAKVTGELTIHGVTRNVTFNVEGPTAPAKDPWGNTRVGVAATAKINRRDFGLTWNAALETGGILVGDEVTITIEAQFIRQ